MDGPCRTQEPEQTDKTVVDQYIALFGNKKLLSQVRTDSKQCAERCRGNCERQRLSEESSDHTSSYSRVNRGGLEG